MTGSACRLSGSRSFQSRRSSKCCRSYCASPSNSGVRWHRPNSAIHLTPGADAWLKGNLEALDEVYAADYVWHRPPFPVISGIEAVKESVEQMRSAYSDIQVVYEEVVGEGSSIAYRYSIRAMHTGVTPTMPVPPTNKEVTLVGCVVVHIADGKIVEEFEHSDYLGFLQQIGVIPPLG